MTSKHFAAIAQAMLASKPNELSTRVELNVWTRACRNVANACAHFNDNFDREKFLKACGYGVYDVTRDQMLTAIRAP